MSNLKLNRSKSGIKDGTEKTFKFLSYIFGDSNYQNNFPDKLLLTNTQVLRLRKALANSSSANIKISKTKLHKIGQSEGFLGRILGPLIKIGLLLMKNVFKTLAKSVLIPVGLTTSASATDAHFTKKQVFH